MSIHRSSAQRVVVVAAHPDDEIMGAGALLRRLSLASARIEMIHVTDGAPPDGRDARAHRFGSVEAYARARRLELVRAVEAAGISCVQYVALGVPDQRAAHTLVWTTHALADRFREHPADVILTHAFEGGHPDHDATAFAVHAATRLTKQSHPAPAVLEFASYHLGPDGIETGTFVAGSGPACSVLQLTPDERRVKRRARDCFVSQAATLASFGMETESFRTAPCYEFASRPHAGRLLYEFFDWGLRADDWERLATEALASLHL